jgi:hypothetical protein
VNTDVQKMIDALNGKLPNLTFDNSNDQNLIAFGVDEILVKRNILVALYPRSG